ncbi:MAG TPA: ABC transporter permease [Blastocatellia bacterium]|nr:ABC transporter permease [Blastocatellia bacterium]
MRVTHNFRENLALALSTIWEHKVRSSLTLLGVVVGTMTVVAVGSVLTGMNKRVGEITEKFGPNVAFISKYDSIGIRFGRMSQEERRRRDLTVDDANAVAQLSSVKGATPSLTLGSFGPSTSTFSVKYRDIEFARPLVFGVNGNYPSIRSIEVTRGRFFTDGEVQRREQVAVIAESVADTLFGGLNPLEKEVELDGKPFRIIGVTKRGVGGLFGGDGADDRFIYIPFETLAKMHPELTNISITMRANDGQMAKMFDDVTETLRRRRGVRVDKPNDFSISTPDAIFETIGSLTRILGMIVIPLSFAGVLVGGVGVMNIMLVSVTERTKEIGVRRAVGARRADIIWQFLIEAMSLTGIGGLGGIFVGWLISTIINLLVPAIPSAVPAWAVGLGFGISVAIGLVFGLWPAFKAARLDPIDALRYE